MPIWLEMLLGTVSLLCGLGLAVTARPGPKQRLAQIGGAILALFGAYFFFSKAI